MADENNPQPEPDNPAGNPGAENKDDTPVAPSDTAAADSTDSTNLNGVDEDKGDAQDGEQGPDEGAEGKQQVEAEEEEMQPVEDPGPPPEPTPIFISVPSQEIYECVTEGEKDVSEANPMKFVLLQTIQDDLKTRRAVCDFAPFKDKINKFKGESVLLVYDAAYVYGENFFCFLNAEDQEHYVKHVAYLKWVEYQKTGKKKKKKQAGDDGDDEDESESDDDDDEIENAPPAERPPEWISLGSESEVIAEQCVPTRSKMRIVLSRRRRLFGAPRKFTDRPNEILNEDGENVAVAEFASVPVDPDPDNEQPILNRSQLDAACQAVLVTTNGSSQTNYAPPRNIAVSCQITVSTTSSNTTATDTSIDNTLDDDAKKLDAFLSTVYPQVRDALVENEKLQLFQDDFAALASDNSAVVVGKTESNLKEYQSYKYTGANFEQTIPCCAWHPDSDDIVAVSCARRLKYDDRVDMALCAIKSIIAVWNLSNPIEPQLLLEAPDDVVSLAFNPTDPMLLAGGCVNGQVLLWNLSRHSDLIGKAGGAQASSDKRELAYLPPIVATAIEHSHHASVSDVIWLPAEVEITRSGSLVPEEEKTQKGCFQLLSVAADASSLVWDLRSALDKDEIYSRSGLKKLDLTWRPLLKIFVGLETGLDNGGRKVAIRDSTFLCEETADDELKTKLFIGTERGNIVYLDWKAPESDNGKIGVQTYERAFSAHSGPVVALKRSPFFPSLVMSVGGQSVCLWHEDCKGGTLLSATINGAQATSGEWSCQRPSVFFVSKSDGTIDVWDLMDSSYNPVIVVPICSAPICFLKTKLYSNESRNFMAACDDEGILHVLELPLGLSVPVEDEMNRLKSYMKAEFDRLDYVATRMEARSQNASASKADDDNEEEKAVLTEAGGESEKLYQEYLKQERQFLIDMGLLTPEDEEGNTD